MMFMSKKVRKIPCEEVYICAGYYSNSGEGEQHFRIECTKVLDLYRE